MKVVCISGHAQNGKDTAAVIMAEQLRNNGKKVLIAHYADLLKYICRMFFGWDGKKDEHGREILQYVGTDIIRRQRPDFWVDFIISILGMFGDNWDYVLIPDTRFPDEINKLKKFGFQTEHVRIVRPNFISPLPIEQQKHLSETALDNIQPDFTIVNSGTLKDFKANIINYLREYAYEQGK